MKQITITLVLLLAAAGEARAGVTHSWAWAEPPDPAALRKVLDDMERQTAGVPGLTEVHRTGDSLSVICTAHGERARFEFPGKTGLNVLVTAGQPCDDLISAWLIAAEKRFPDVLATAGDDPEGIYSGAVEEPEARRIGSRPASLSEGLTSLLYPALMALFFIVMMARGGGSWTSYYLFWMVAPTLAFFVLRQPLVLLVVPVAIIARRVLPDPIALLRKSGRIRSLSADVDANAHNVTARRALAMLWLDLRRPRKALPLVEQALVREPEDAELHHLRGLALLGARRWQDALDAFIAVLDREPRLRYGDAYLRGADALLKLRRWGEAQEGLEHFTQVNKSTVEGWVKLAQARRAQGDTAGAEAAVAQAKAIYKGSPSFHRRKQLWWYARALVGR